MQRHIHLLTAVLALAAVPGGCAHQPDQSTLDYERRMRERGVLHDLAAEVKRALHERRREDAAAAFTPEREQLVGERSEWQRGVRELYGELVRVAKTAAERGELAEAIRLLEIVTRVPNYARHVDIEKVAGPYRQRLARQQEAWATRLGAAAADEAAGRPATAAVRYATATAPPSEREAARLVDKVCELVGDVAAAHALKIHLAAGRSDRGLLEAMLARVRNEPFGGTVIFVASAGEADLSLLVSLGEARFEHAVTSDTRTGQYNSGVREVTNPKIADLRKEIARLDKEISSRHKQIASINCGSSATCKSRDAARQSLQRDTERRAAKQQDLARQPATVRQGVQADHTYPVKIHTWKLAIPVTVEARPRGGAPNVVVTDVWRDAKALEHGPVEKLGLRAVTAKTADRGPLEAAVREDCVKSAPYVVHRNLVARNTAIVNKITASAGAERAELVATWLALNPHAAEKDVTFGNNELKTLIGVYPGATALAKQTGACWQRASAVASGAAR